MSVDIIGGGGSSVQIKLATRHGHLSEEHQKQITEKADKLTHFFDRITMIEVMVDLQKDSAKFVEVKVDAEHKHDFISHHTDAELMVAVDAAIDKMIHQLHRYKEKIQDHRRAPSTGEGPNGD